MQLHPTRIEGTIALSDGRSTVAFAIDPEYGWTQWGSTTDKLGVTVDLVEALAAAAFEAGLTALDEAAS